MATISLDGTLEATPPDVSEGGFPAASTQIPLQLTGGTPGKSSPACTGAKQRSVQSPSAFVPLHGVGTGEDVAQADTLYLRTTAAMKVRLTFADASQAVVPVLGLVVLEFDPSNRCTAVEAQGSGTIEMLASGTAT